MRRVRASSSIPATMRRGRSRGGRVDEIGFPDNEEACRLTDNSLENRGIGLSARFLLCAFFCNVRAGRMLAQLVEGVSVLSGKL